MTKCSSKVKLNVYVTRKCSPTKTSKGVYSVMKSVYSRQGDRVALELPHCVKTDLTFKEAHALKRQIIADYFG